MNPTPLNTGLASLVGPDNYPLDWADEVKFYGLSRHEALKHYVVRLAVEGKQIYLGTAYSQKTGAKLYDLALWKFAGKMSRSGRINFPDGFVFITQEVIDRDCPRLNELYAKIPFLKSEDEKLTEQQLREQRLENGFTALRKSGVHNSYAVAITRLKRWKMNADDIFARIEAEHNKLDLRKLPDLATQFHDIETQLASLSLNLARLAGAMESQQDYYRKVKNEISEI